MTASVIIIDISFLLILSLKISLILSKQSFVSSQWPMRSVDKGAVVISYTTKG